MSIVSGFMSITFIKFTSKTSNSTATTTTMTTDCFLMILAMFAINQTRNVNRSNFKWKFGENEYLTNFMQNLFTKFKFPHNFLMGESNKFDDEKSVNEFCGMLKVSFMNNNYSWAAISRVCCLIYKNWVRPVNNMLGANAAGWSWTEWNELQC